MSIFRREMQRNAELTAKYGPVTSEHHDRLAADPEYRAYCAEMQARLIVYEPWMAVRNGWDLEECLAPYGEDYLAVCTLVSCCMLIDKERYMEMYIKHRDHDEFTFQEFAKSLILMAHEDPDFVWDPKTKFPLPVRDSRFDEEGD